MAQPVDLVSDALLVIAQQIPLLVAHGDQMLQQLADQLGAMQVQLGGMNVQLGNMQGQLHGLENLVSNVEQRSHARVLNSHIRGPESVPWGLVASNGLVPVGFPQSLGELDSFTDEQLDGLLEAYGLPIPETEFKKLSSLKGHMGLVGTQE